jgi:molybdopterin-guanine dinucleotide biosynthesis protein A
MGTDKALIEIDGRALALRVADALAAAGATEVIAVGGDLGRLGALGLDARPDRAPGQGPLAGIVTALELTQAEVVVVAACDLVSLTAAAISELLGALTDDADAVIPRRSRLEPLMAAYRRRCLDHLRTELETGERAPHRAVEGLAVVQVRLQHDGALRDADTPGDLPIA